MRCKHVLRSVKNVPKLMFEQTLRRGVKISINCNVKQGLHVVRRAATWIIAQGQDTMKQQNGSIIVRSTTEEKLMRRQTVNTRLLLPAPTVMRRNFNAAKGGDEMKMINELRGRK